MGITARNEYHAEPHPAGTYAGRCYSMITLGTTLQADFNGKEKPRTVVKIGFEMPTETKDDGSPKTISKKYTLSMHENANLRKMLEGWRGKKYTEEEAKAFDITKLLSQPCMLTIVHSEWQGRKFANIDSISPVPMVTNPVTKKKEPMYVVPPQILATEYFSFEDSTMDDFEKLSTYVQQEIKVSREWNEFAARFRMDATVNDESNTAVAEPVTADDLPF